MNRLRPLLSQILSLKIKALIPGRLISDNSIIVFECIHHIQSMKHNEPAACAYKLDLSKAYDRVDWDFLEQALSKWGFSALWISWIMACVKSVKYSVKFNGKLLHGFTPSRGLRQGDPLSPFLSLFVADAVSALISKSVNEGELKGVTICRGAPIISHLLFADDTMLLFEASDQQASIVKGLLNTYTRATGQLGKVFHPFF